MDVFNTQSSKLVKKLQKRADGKLFDIFPDITNCTLDIICGLSACSFVVVHRLKAILSMLD